MTDTAKLKRREVYWAANAVVNGYEEFNAWLASVAERGGEVVEIRDHVFDSNQGGIPLIVYIGIADVPFDSEQPKPKQSR